MVYMAEKSLKEHGDKVGDDIKKDVQEKIDALKSARSSTDAAVIRSASDALSTSMQKIGAAMSQNQQQSAPQDQKPPEEPKQ